MESRVSARQHCSETIESLAAARGDRTIQKLLTLASAAWTSHRDGPELLNSERFGSLAIYAGQIKKRLLGPSLVDPVQTVQAMLPRSVAASLTRQRRFILRIKSYGIFVQDSHCN